MFCEKCGFQIDEDSVFCQKCGEKVISSADVNNLKNQHTPIQTPVPKNSFWNKKHIFIVAALVLVVTVILICCLYLFDVVKKSSEEISEPATSTSTSEPTKNTIIESDYLGYWLVDNIDNGELEITSIKDDKVSFIISFFSSGSVSGVVPLDGNVANFSYHEGAITVEGTLIFNESSITVNITKSNFDDLKIGTIVYNSKYPGSWSDRLENNSNVNTDSPSLSVSEAKAIVKELIKSSEKINDIFYGLLDFTNYELLKPEEYNAVTDPRYKNIADIKIAIETVYTKSLAETSIYPNMFGGNSPQYIERDGQLFVLYIGTGGHSPDWKIDTLTIVTQTSDTVLLEMDAEDNMDGTTSQVSREIKKENGKWLLNDGVYY